MMIMMMTVWFNAPMQHQSYEARRSGRLRINLDHLRSINVRQNLHTRVFSVSASI